MGALAGLHLAGAMAAWPAVRLVSSVGMARFSDAVSLRLSNFWPGLSN
jgi:hypothetical protein